MPDKITNCPGNCFTCPENCVGSRANNCACGNGTCDGKTCECSPDPLPHTKPRTACSAEMDSDGHALWIRYCNSAGYATCDKYGKPTYVQANCGSTNCPSSNNPPTGVYVPGTTGSGSHIIVDSQGNPTDTTGMNLPDNKPPTCNNDCTCTCGSDCACGSSNCSTACVSSISKSSGTQRNCLSFCPTINCDRE